ncbi:hypothetical protein T459_26424 [Capsicum annuum]|uniref:Uncharacterized protein n=1 Tax=Capsicum annuum TaxID=4072 RepID=A0A2G2YNL2_CAPAN|nr:hypothetical protein T459_26424 [Capsicum annuum]
MKKEGTKTFREYAIRCHEQAARVKPPMKESHSIEDCRDLEREIEKMIQDGSIMVQNIDSEGNSIHAEMQTSGYDVKLSN